MKQYDIEQNRKTALQHDVYLWSESDLQRITGAFERLVAVGNSKEIGSRLAQVLKASKKPRSHTYHVLASPVGAYAARHASDMPAEVRNTYASVLLALNKIQQKSFSSAAELEEARIAVVEALVAVDEYLPCTCLDIKNHNLLHLSLQVAQHGPLWTNAMWAYENIFGIIMRHLKNRRHAESNIMRSVADLEEASLATIDRQQEEEGVDADTLASQHFWLPDTMHGGERVVDLGITKHTQISQLQPSAGMTAKLHLHLFYVHQIPAYARLWNRFLVLWVTERRPDGVSRPGGVFQLTPTAMRLAFKEFQEATLAALPEGLTTHRLLDGGWRASEAVVGGARFRTCARRSELNTATELQKGDTWLMARKAEGDDSMYIGQPQYFIKHTGPDGQTRLLCLMHSWHKQVDTDHGIGGMPVFSSAVMSQPGGNAWELDQVAAVNFMVVRHYNFQGRNRNRWMVLHRDPRFARVAGF